MFSSQPDRQKSFKEQFKLEERIVQCNQKQTKYPHMIPLIIEKKPKSKLPNLQKQIFLVTHDFRIPTFREFMRKSFGLNEKSNIFFYQGTMLIAEDQNIVDLFNKSRDQDGFLYITYSDMDVFGFKHSEQHEKVPL